MQQDNLALSIPSLEPNEMGHSISARILSRVKVYGDRLNHLIVSAPCDERASSQLQSWLSDPGEAN